MSYFKNFDIQKIIKSIRVAINPELRIPADKESHPVNWRITRIRDLIADTTKKHDELTADLKNIQTNLEGLLEELNQIDEADDAPKSEPSAKTPSTKPAKSKAESKPKSTSKAKSTSKPKSAPSKKTDKDDS